MREIDKYVERLEQIKRNDTTTMGLIAGYFIEKLDDESALGDAKRIAGEIGVSNAMISKFSKKMNYKNIYEILFLHDLYIKNKFRDQKEVEIATEAIKEAAQIINTGRKIFLLGVSNGYSINSDFARKINRLDMWTYLSDNKYEQIGVSRLLTSSDVIVASSASLQHQWMRDIIRETRSKVILISHVLPDELTEHVDLFLPFESKGKDLIHRTHSNESRFNSLTILDDIFNCLIQIDGNRILLNTTRYNKK